MTVLRGKPGALRFRYHTRGKWFQGALHTHTTRSDGRFSVKELLHRYRQCGYDFVAITDHMRLAAENGDHDGLLVIKGVELQGRAANRRPLHVVALAPPYDPSTLPGGLHATIDDLLRRGTIVIAAHPHWSDCTSVTLERHAYTAVEIWNYAAGLESGKPYGLPYWDHLLGHGRDVLGVAADDTHGSRRVRDYNGAWVVVNAERLTQDAVLASLKAGNFYSSTGPVLEDIHLDADALHVRTSPVVLARLIGRNGRGGARFFESPQREFALPLPREEDVIKRWRYVRLEVQDASGGTAWTNSLFPPPDKAQSLHDPGTP